MLIERRPLHHFDWPLFFLVMAIPLGGLVVLGSAGYDPDTSIPLLGFESLTLHSKPLLKQGLFLLFGLAVLFSATGVSSRFWYRYAYWIYGGSIALLLGVFLYGSISHGSRRWISVAGYNFQPSELAKIALVLALARYMSKAPPRRFRYGFSELLIPFCIIALPMGLILEQPDLGTALAVGAIGGLMLLFAGVQGKTLFGLFVAGTGAVMAAWFWVLRPYQKLRVMTMFNAESDPQGSGWHIIQSKIAVGSGELFGKGYLRGSQGQLEFLPERTTDFIFCVLAEEFGFVGSIVLLALYVLLLLRMLQLVLRTRELFPALVIFGVGAMLFFHTIVNLGMVLGYFPVVGIPLPLFSYGGSSLLIFCLSLGIVFGLVMRRTVFSKR